MLNIIKASGAQDLPEILFRGIAKSLEALKSGSSGAKRVILVVPAQFTLKAEELAFQKLGGDGFFDLHIVSNNKLAQQIIGEVGGMGRTPVNTLGRSMLLRKILREQGPELDVFSSVSQDSGFIEMAGDFIVQLKQNNVAPGVLSEIAGGARGELLSGKLSDMQRVCEAYDLAMEGRYNDSEDLRAYVTSRIRDCSWVCDSEFWYYDFYSFTQRDADFLGELLRCSKGVNILLLCGDSNGRPELFAAPERTAKELAERARAQGIPYSISTAEGCQLSRPDELSHIEKQLFRLPPDAALSAADPSVLQVVEAESPETQAEAIAVKLLELVRERGYRPQELAVLTNDISGQGSAIKRVFTRYGIPFFMDEKRGVQHSPAVSAVCALLDIAADAYPADAVLRFLKSGYSGIVSYREACAFENYTVQYHIKGRRFLLPFKYGREALGDAVFEELEAVRARLAALLTPFAEAFGKAPLVRDKTVVLYNFLEETLQLSDVLDMNAQELAEAGYPDASEELSQIWDIITGLLEQVCELLGDEEMSSEEYRELLSASFADIKVGLLPQAEGRVLIGTVDRTRLSGVKALFIAGINDGILPAERNTDGILTEREQAELEDMGIVLAKSRGKLRQEELLSVYRTFCEASEYLWLGCCMTNLDGEALKPSPLFGQVLSMFPGLEASPDPVSSGERLAFVQSPASAAEHMTTAFREYLSGESAGISDVWKLSCNELGSGNDLRLEAIKAGLFYRNDPGKLSQERFEEMYARDGVSAVLSPSRLETFAGCPFSYFVDYGLRPAERKSFEISGSEIGTVCHECLLRLSERLDRRARSAGVPANDPSSDWMTVSKEQISALVAEILSEMSESSLDGLLSAGSQEIYRTGRIRKLCETVAWQLVEQVRRGSIDRMLFETTFGKHGRLPALTVDTPLGKVNIEGKIDRVDVISSGNAEYIKVIDYKTGSTTFDRKAAENGRALQLNIYLESAINAGLAEKPAGMFFFSVSDARQEASLLELAPGEISARLEDILKKSYRLNGLVVGETPVIQAIDRGIDEGEPSVVLGVSKDKTGAYKGSAVTKTVSEEEFEEFRETVKNAVKSLCTDMLSGDISIDPGALTGGRDRSACTYCRYKSVCLFEA